MKIGFISNYGEGMDIAFRMSKQGNEVRPFIVDKDCKRIYDGIMTKEKSWEPLKTWADLIVYDSTKMNDIWSKMPKSIPQFGGSKFADDIEHDRALGHNIMEEAGLEKIERFSFKTYDEAITHAITYGKKAVYKSHGPKIESQHLIISNMESGEDAEAMLTNMQDEGLTLDKPLEVEEKIDGIEAAITVFMNGKGVMGRYGFINFETKRQFSGNNGDGLGPLTGEQGETAIWINLENTRLWKDALEKVIPRFVKENYRGLIDIGFIVTPEGKLKPTEFTPRFGIPPIYLMWELSETPLAEIFMACATGKDLDFKVKSDWCAATVVVTPGFPYHKEVEKISKNVPIFGITDKNREHIHLYEAAIGKVGKKQGLVTTGGIGYVGVITASGPTLEIAQSRLYRMANQNSKENMYVLNSSYRDDIGRRVLENKEEIVELGILPKEAFEE